MSADQSPWVLASISIRAMVLRRLTEFYGLVLGLTGVGLLVALVSYTPRDWSLNTASSQNSVNIAGPIGAAVSDLLLQAFGIAAVFPAFAMVAWAWQISGHKRVANPTMRLVSVIAGVPMLAVVAASSTIVADGSWPTDAGIGGAIGFWLASYFVEALRALLGGFAPMAAWCIAVALAGFLVCVGCGLPTRRQRVDRKMPSPLRQKVERLAGKLTALVKPPRQLQTISPHPSLDAITRRAPAFDPVPSATLVRQVDRQPASPPAVSRRDVSPLALAQKTSVHEQTRVPEVLDRSEGAVGGWRLPPISLLVKGPGKGETSARIRPGEDALKAVARSLETVLDEYGVQGIIRAIHPGPVITLYELEPAPGIRSTRVIGLADDLARSLSVSAVRIATVTGRNVIGIEVPNACRETVYLSELLGAEDLEHTPGKLILALGKDISGEPVFADLSRMPHLLVAGTTGSGKSVGINAMILSLLYRLSPSQCRLILIDPKMLELSVYDGIPHLMAPVVTEPAKAVKALKWTVREMERRYRSMSQLGVRNLAGYNERVIDARSRSGGVTRRVQTGFDLETGKPTFEEQPLALELLPLLVIVIDEMADLMMVAGKEIEITIQRLAQMARAAGIHVIMATQRPSVDVITGTIKANFPTRISFTVISKFDSRTILGEQGAEQLLGQGDMLYMQGGGRVSRVHGPFVSDSEVEDVVAFLREQGEPIYLEEVTEGQDDTAPSTSGSAGAVESDRGFFDQAVAIVASEGRASTSFIQRHLSIGYNRAAKLIEQMEKEGIVSAANHVGKRDVLIKRVRD